MRGAWRILSVLLLLALFIPAGPGMADGAPHLGYGVNPVNAADSGIGAMGFDWTKTFDVPSGRLPYRVLARLEVHADVLSDLTGWGANLESRVRAGADYVEAWEIGNEPNLDASFGWNAPPNAADYTRVLCEAYRRIKRADPTALVVSAGLAPVGRIPFSYNGHRGYCAPGVGWCAGYYQDEREFLREMLSAGAAACMDALGYHPYGFAAPYDAAPGSPACGPNDFCFRGVEVIRSIMVNEFGVDRPIWATEFGWIVDPRQVGRSECWDDPSMGQFHWMVVSPDQQATNLVGAYTWAETHYPWMGPMFVFNYGFDRGGCNQMNFFDIKGRPAESALQNMTKNRVPSRPFWSGPGGALVPVDDPRPVAGAAVLGNRMPEPLSWSASLLSSGFPLTLTRTSGSYRELLTFVADPTGLALGAYTATFWVTATPVINIPVENPTRTLTFTLRVVERVERLYLPVVLRAGP